MKAQTVLQKVQSRFDQVTGFKMESGNGARRMSHGGSAWSLPRGVNGLRQPQDGAAPAKGSASLLAALHSRTNPFEPEDAGMTGGTRSLSRRLMGLNVTAAPRKPAAAVVAALARRQAA